MTLVQYLCTLLSEECNELGQRASKLSRFGKDEIQPNQKLENFERLRLEKVDLLVIYNLLLSATGKVDNDKVVINIAEHRAKEDKIIKFTELSVECGQLSQDLLNELIQHTYKKNERRLGFTTIFAGSDLGAFKKSSEQEADAVMVNTNIKIFTNPKGYNKEE
jgi:hypothetical protein